MINQFFQIIGMLTCALLVIWLIARLYYGKQWHIHLGLGFFAGPRLIKAIKKLYKEFPDKIERETLAEVTGQVIIRLTRIGLIGLLVAVIPIWLLMQQNGLLRQQNDKFDLQNERLNLQNNLLEADRRSSLVFLMSNILDKVDEEIREQKQKMKVVTDSTKYSLSKPLVNRIIALSKAFKPYRMMEGDSLSDLVSPERGQLFIALMENSLDSATQNTIVERGDFSRAVIGEVVIPFSNLSGAYLSGADLSGAYLWGTYLWGAYLSGANLSGADLSEADLWGADLWGADLWGADLWGANLSGADLSEADLSEADLWGADLSEADLSEADLWGADLSEADLWGADLSEADLREADLWGADLRGADLRGAYLSGAYLRGAYLRGAYLSGADLWGADLRGADLRGADLWGADLRRADLWGADLWGADLWGADLWEAYLDSAKNITTDQLKLTHSLYRCINLDSLLKAQLEKEKPCLFTEEGCPVE